MSSRRKRTRKEVGERNVRPRIPLAPGGAAAGGGAAASATRYATDLPERTVELEPLNPTEEYIWEDREEPTGVEGWLPLDWAGRRKGFRQQEDARVNTLYGRGITWTGGNYVDLTQRPGSRLNPYRDQVDLTGPETAEEEAI
eukprot:COSAG02_NODE_38714_length_425_cov_11.530675_1_plen_141_part_11